MALVPARYQNNDSVANMQEFGSSSARAIGTQLLRTNESGRYIGIQMNTRTGEYNCEIEQNDPRNDHFQYRSFRRP